MITTKEIQDRIALIEISKELHEKDLQNNSLTEVEIDSINSSIVMCIYAISQLDWVLSKIDEPNEPNIEHLLSFGNFLFANKRKESFNNTETSLPAETRLKQVTHADVANWIEEQK